MNRAPGTTQARRRFGTAAQIIVALMLAVMLAGCGRKGAPTPPTDKPNTYPRSYPSA